MTAKEYLGQIKALISSLKRLSLQAQSLEETLTGASPHMSAVPGSPVPDTRRMEKLLAAKVDVERKIDDQSTKLTEIMHAINSLPNHVHSAILTARYVAGMEWHEIVNDLRISRSHVYRNHSDALHAIEKFLKLGTK
jgi:DNA-directed RNA polymerase specialized sigma subunit